ARLRRVGHRYWAFDLAARQRRAPAERPRRQLALFRERRHDLGANSRNLRSAGADAAASRNSVNHRNIRVSALFSATVLQPVLQCLFSFSPLVELPDDGPGGGGAIDILTDDVVHARLGPTEDFPDDSQWQSGGVEARGRRAAQIVEVQLG